MSDIIVKLTKAGRKSGPFTILDNLGNIIATGVDKQSLIEGISYTIDDSATNITIINEGEGCSTTKTKSLGNPIDVTDLASIGFTDSIQTCLWRHLTDITLYNSYYGIISPYILEVPFMYQFNDEILQSVKSYDKVYQYIQDGTGVFNYNDKIEVDDKWFNKSIVYNSQQSSGTLNLIPKPKNNLKLYMSYPLYNSDSKDIIYTKTDSFYNYNTFWNIVNDKTKQLFITPCTTSSLDKQINNDNMNYGDRSFKKSPMRAKNSKIRHILDDRSDIHIVSKFITQSTQKSYK